MFCRRNQWEGARFPRHLFHDSRSKRGGVLMHTKVRLQTKLIVFLTRACYQMILGLYRSAPSLNRAPGVQSQVSSEQEDDDIVEVRPRQADCIGWVYVGSHNFTPSAWGTVSGSSFRPSINVRVFSRPWTSRPTLLPQITNFELGVLFPLLDDAHIEF